MIDQLTLNGPVPFGYHPNRTVAAAEMRQRCVCVVGEQGSGKTVVVQNFVAGLVRCPDCIVWVIDLGGSLAAPWMDPWLDRDLDRPPIDWVAYDLDTALAMSALAVEVVRGRRRTMRPLLRQHNTDLLPVSYHTPAIYIVIDEGKEAAGIAAHPQLVANLTTFVDIGRSMAGRVLITGIRATSEYLPRSLMAGMGIRVAMSVADEAELGYLMGWRGRFNPRDFPRPGCGIWRDGLAGDVRRFRSFGLTRPSQIADIAYACEPWRPVLDAPSLAGVSAPLRDAYEARHEYMLDAFSDGDSGLILPAHVSPPAPAHPGAPAGSFGADLSAVDAAIARARHVIAGERVKAAPPEAVDAEFDRLAEQLADDRAAGGDGWRDDEPAGNGDAEQLVRAAAGDLGAVVLGVLAGAGEEGMSGPEVHATLRTFGIDVSQRTVYRCLESVAIKARWGSWIHPGHGKTGGKLP